MKRISAKRHPNPVVIKSRYPSIQGTAVVVMAGVMCLVVVDVKKFRKVAAEAVVRVLTNNMDSAQILKLSVTTKPKVIRDSAALANASGERYT